MEFLKDAETIHSPYVCASFPLFLYPASHRAHPRAGIMGKNLGVVR